MTRWLRLPLGLACAALSALFARLVSAMADPVDHRCEACDAERDAPRSLR